MNGAAPKNFWVSWRGFLVYTKYYLRFRGLVQAFLPGLSYLQAFLWLSRSGAGSMVGIRAHERHLVPYTLEPSLTPS